MLRNTACIEPAAPRLHCRSPFGQILELFILIVHSMRIPIYPSAVKYFCPGFSITLKIVLCFTACILFLHRVPESSNALHATPPTYQSGLDVLIKDHLHFLQGKRLGIITNHSAVTVDSVHILDILPQLPGVDLRAVFTPEHGLTGMIEGGKHIHTSRHGLVPVYSLYGSVRKPTPEMLQSVDVLLYDIQDVGTRFYTYISTMGLAMEAAAEQGLSFLVLDRPNPINGILVEGPVLSPTVQSFVGAYPIPIRYGMTAGELAVMIRGEQWISSADTLDLHVIQMKGWTRDLWFDECGAPWIPPSPNIPSVETAILYPGMGLFEGTNVSEGRGTSSPFQFIGAPWMDAHRVTAQLRTLHLPGVEFTPVTFTPQSNPGSSRPKYHGELCHGVRVEIHNRTIYHSVRTAFAFFTVLHEIHPNAFTFNHRISHLTGIHEFSQQFTHIRLISDIADSQAVTDFISLRQPYLLYPARCTMH